MSVSRSSSSSSGDERGQQPPPRPAGPPLRPRTAVPGQASAAQADDRPPLDSRDNSVVPLPPSQQRSEPKKQNEPESKQPRRGRFDSLGDDQKPNARETIASEPERPRFTTVSEAFDLPRKKDPKKKAGVLKVALAAVKEKLDKPEKAKRVAVSHLLHLLSNPEIDPKFKRVTEGWTLEVAKAWSQLGEAKVDAAAPATRGVAERLMRNMDPEDLESIYAMASAELLLYKKPGEEEFESPLPLLPSRPFLPFLQFLQSNTCRRLEALNPALSPALQQKLRELIHAATHGGSGRAHADPETKDRLLRQYLDVLLLADQVAMRSGAAIPMLEVIMDALAYIKVRHPDLPIENLFAVLPDQFLKDVLQDVHAAGSYPMLDRSRIYKTVRADFERRREETKVSLKAMLSQLREWPHDPDTGSVRSASELAKKVIELAEIKSMYASYQAVLDPTGKWVVLAADALLPPNAVLPAVVLLSHPKELRKLDRDPGQLIALHAAVAELRLSGVEGISTRVAAHEARSLGFHLAHSRAAVRALLDLGQGRADLARALKQIQFEVQARAASTIHSARGSFREEIFDAVRDLTEDERRNLTLLMQSPLTLQLTAVLAELSRMSNIKKHAVHDELVSIEAMFAAVTSAVSASVPDTRLVPIENLEQMNSEVRHAIDALGIEISAPHVARIRSGVASQAVQADVKAALAANMARRGAPVIDVLNARHYFEGVPLIDDASLRARVYPKALDGTLSKEEIEELEIKLEKDLNLMRTKAMTALLKKSGGNAGAFLPAKWALLGAIAKVASVHAWDGIDAAMSSPHSPFQGPDGTPIKLVGHRTARFDIRPSADGGAIVRCRLTIVDPTHAWTVGPAGHERVRLENWQDQAFTSEVEISKAGAARQIQPVDVEPVLEKGKGYVLGTTDSAIADVEMIFESFADRKLVADFRDQLKVELSLENFDVLAAVGRLQQHPNAIDARMLVDEFIRQGVERQVNLPSQLRLDLEGAVESESDDEIVKGFLKHLDALRRELIQLVARDTLTRFKARLTAEAQEAIRVPPEDNEVATVRPFFEPLKLPNDPTTQKNHKNLRKALNQLAVPLLPADKVAIYTRMLVLEVTGEDPELRTRRFVQHMRELLGNISPAGRVYIAYNLEHGLHEAELKDHLDVRHVRLAIASLLRGSREGRMTPESVILENVGLEMTIERLLDWFMVGSINALEVENVFSQLPPAKLNSFVDTLDKLDTSAPGARNERVTQLAQVGHTVIAGRKTKELRMSSDGFTSMATAFTNELGASNGPLSERNIKGLVEAAASYSQYMRATKVAERDLSEAKPVIDAAALIANAALQRQTPYGYHTMRPNEVEGFASALTTLGIRPEQLAPLAELPPPPDDKLPPAASGPVPAPPDEP